MGSATACPQAAAETDYPPQAGVNSPPGRAPTGSSEPACAPRPVLSDSSADSELRGERDIEKVALIGVEISVGRLLDARLQQL